MTDNASATTDSTSASVLVTGGAGYIGSHTVRLLAREGYRPVVLDSLEFGRADAVLDAPLIVGNISDESLVADICRREHVDAIVHFAAYKSVGESMSDPGRYVHNNISNSAHLFDAARSAGVEHIVFSSSCSVYGTPDRVPVDETAPIRPESVYADTKAIVERLLDWYDQIAGLRSVSLRYFNAAGASADAAIGENWDTALNLIPVAMKALLTDSGELSVFGSDYPTPDGTCIRDYVHVDDLAWAHVRAVDYLRRGGATTALNLGTGHGSSVIDVLSAIEQVAGRPVPHRFEARRAGDPVATYADATKARELLGWTATNDLTDIVASAFRWHLSQL